MTERLKDLFIEFDEMGFSPTIPCGDLEKAAVEWRDKVVKEIAALESENAALRERLGKAWELPFGDRVWFITEDEEGAESYIISKPTDLLTVDELYEIGKKYFTTREAAEARLAELKGEQK